MGIDAVEGRPLVAEVGEAARALLLMDFNTGVDPFFFAQFLEAGAQRFKPLVVDNIRSTV